MVLKIAQIPRFRAWITRSRTTRNLVNRFIAGNDIEEALPKAKELNARGFLVSLDYLGEDTRLPEEAQQSARQYIHLLERIAQSGTNANISIKLTQLGLDLDQERCSEHLRTVLQAAKERNNFVWVDMESSQHTQAILDVFCGLYPEYPNSGTVLQSYLYRTPEDLERLIALGARVRMVKGAYAEPKEVAYTAKKMVDQKFITLTERLLDAGHEPAIATHDPKLIAHTKRYATHKGLDKQQYEFQLLFGISRDMQRRLVSEGHRTLIYVPYGDQWYAYFTRRLAERPANLLFILRSLLRG